MAIPWLGGMCGQNFILKDKLSDTLLNYITSSKNETEVYIMNSQWLIKQELMIHPYFMVNFPVFLLLPKKDIPKKNIYAVCTHFWGNDFYAKIYLAIAN